MFLTTAKNLFYFKRLDDGDVTDCSFGLSTSEVDYMTENQDFASLNEQSIFRSDVDDESLISIQDSTNGNLDLCGKKSVSASTHNDILVQDLNEKQNKSSEGDQFVQVSGSLPIINLNQLEVNTQNTLGSLQVVDAAGTQLIQVPPGYELINTNLDSSSLMQVPVTVIDNNAGATESMYMLSVKLDEELPENSVELVANSEQKSGNMQSDSSAKTGEKSDEADEGEKNREETVSEIMKQIGEDITQPQLTSTPSVPVPNMDETIIAGNLQYTMHPVPSLDELRPIENETNKEEDIQPEPLFKKPTSTVIKRAKAPIKIQIAEKASVPTSAQPITQDEKSHNITYCKDWVASARDTGTNCIPLNHTIRSAHTDLSVDTSQSLLDVTSVSRNVPKYQKKSATPNTQEHIVKSSLKVTETTTTM